MVDAFRSSGDEIFCTVYASIGYFCWMIGESATSASFVRVPIRTPPWPSSLM